MKKNEKLYLLPHNDILFIPIDLKYLTKTPRSSDSFHPSVMYSPPDFPLPDKSIEQNPIPFDITPGTNGTDSNLDPELQ